MMCQLYYTHYMCNKVSALRVSQSEWVCEQADLLVPDIARGWMVEGEDERVMEGPKAKSIIFSWLWLTLIRLRSGERRLKAY